MPDPLVPTPPIAVSSGANQIAQAGAREKFATDELAIVLSHYELGTISEIKDFARGSRKSPKLLIACEAGQYLLKRRARGRDDLEKVTFAHQIQMHLAARQFPLPHLIGTRRHNFSLLQHDGYIYELFEYIPGEGYPQTLDSTFEAGRILALYHKLLEDFPINVPAGTPSFHGAPSIEGGLTYIPSFYGHSLGATTQCAALADAYLNAAAKVESLGLTSWPQQIVHADWHPGNMLFREGRVVAVIDYDSSRVLPRVIDAANGALQFSFVGGDEDLAKWPANLDDARFKRFLKGYDEVVLLSQAEVDAVPWLMIEALIAEAVVPIAQTGKFGRFDGLAFLKMVQRKTSWLAKHAGGLVRLVSE
jgi:Ser/Thr protein kinase RdoA (MazF antagonist)